MTPSAAEACLVAETRAARSGVPGVGGALGLGAPDRRDHLVRRAVADAGGRRRPEEEARGTTGTRTGCPRRSPGRRSGSGSAGSASRAPPRVKTIMPTKAPRVTLAPPYLSASQPPSGRVDRADAGAEEGVVGEVDAGAERGRLGHPEVELDQQRHRGGVADERAEGADVEERHDPGVRLAHDLQLLARLGLAVARLSMKKYAASVATTARPA